MTWIDHQNPNPVTAKTECSVSSVPGLDGRHPRVSLTLRPWLMEGHPAWLKPDAMVRVMIGHGDHAGMIRIVSGGKIKVQQTPVGPRANHASTLQRALNIKLRGMPAPKFKQVAAETDWSNEGEGWIEITVPNMKPDLKPVPAPPLPGKFSMLGGKV